MPTAIQLRLAGLAALIVAVLALVAWSAHASWRKFEELREGLRLTQQFEERIIGLHVELNLLALTVEPQDMQALARKSRELADWIAGEAMSPTTARERALLGRISQAYAGYLADIEEFAARPPPSRAERLNRSVALEERLVRVLQESLAQFLDEVQRGLVPRQTLIFALLGLLLLILVWLSIVVYRGMILPLRIRLVEAGAAIEQSQKLASLGALAAGIAHEIRNPLTAIKARLFTHQRSLAPGTRGYDDAEFIGREINRLERIVREFLLFARPADPELAPVSTLEILREVRELLTAELAKASIELRLEDGPDLVVCADRQHLHQVLINLVRNAAESIGEKGRIALRSRSARLPLRGANRPVAILEVEDNGKGIPPEVQRRLFDPFFTTKSNGTGLGLAVAARIVEKHGGAIRYQTQVNRGTTFGIVLPVEVSR